VGHEQESEQELRSKLQAAEQEGDEFLVGPIGEEGAYEIVVQNRSWSGTEVHRHSRQAVCKITAVPDDSTSTNKEFIFVNNEVFKRFNSFTKAKGDNGIMASPYCRPEDRGSNHV
jgi:hypothetical protein